MTYAIDGEQYLAGMASFSDVLSEADADAIHAYLLAEQRRAYEGAKK